MFLLLWQGVDAFPLEKKKRMKRGYFSDNIGNLGYRFSRGE